MAKLSILNRDIAGFAQRVGNIAWLVREHWEAVNPRAEGDDYSGRIAQLMTLEDNAVVLLPLQYAPLLDTNREGALAYRDQLLATGAVQPRSVTLYDLKGQKQTTEPEKFMPANVDRAGAERHRDRKARRRRRDAQKPRRFDPDDQGGHDRTCRLRERGRAAEARQARGRDDGVPARRAGEARPIARAAARGAAARRRGRRAPERGRRGRRPLSPRAPRSTRRLPPRSAISPPPSRRARRCSSSGRRARRWARTCTR